MGGPVAGSTGAVGHSNHQDKPGLCGLMCEGRCEASTPPLHGGWAGPTGPPRTLTHPGTVAMGRC